MNVEQIPSYYDTIAQTNMDVLLDKYMKDPSNANLRSLIKCYRIYLIHDFTVKKLPAPVLAAAAIEGLL